MTRIKFLLLYLFVLTTGCQESQLQSHSELLAYLSDSDNGFKISRKVNDFDITMTYMPAELLALNESGTLNRAAYLDNLEKFKHSRTFVLSLRHENQNLDITNYNVSNLEDYQRRISYLNFDIKHDLYIQTQTGEKVRPVLVTMENIYEIGDRKNIYMVFSEEDEAVFNSGSIDLIFEDRITNTGINHFVFNKSSWENIPELKFLN